MFFEELIISSRIGPNFNENDYYWKQGKRASRSLFFSFFKGNRYRILNLQNVSVFFFFITHDAVGFGILMKMERIFQFTIWFEAWKVLTVEFELIRKLRTSISLFSTNTYHQSTLSCTGNNAVLKLKTYFILKIKGRVFKSFLIHLSIYSKFLPQKKTLCNRGVTETLNINEEVDCQNKCKTVRKLLNFKCYRLDSYTFQYEGSTSL